MDTPKKRTRYVFSPEQSAKIVELFSNTNPVTRRKALISYAKKIKRTYTAVYNKGASLTKGITTPIGNKSISLNFTSMSIDLKNKRMTFILE